MKQSKLFFMLFFIFHYGFSSESLWKVVGEQTTSSGRLHVTLAKHKCIGLTGQAYTATIQNISGNRLHVVGKVYANLVCGNRVFVDFDYTIEPGETKGGGNAVTSFSVGSVWKEDCSQYTDRGKDSDGSQCYDRITNLGLEFTNVEDLTQKEKEEQEKKEREEEKKKDNKEKRKVQQEEKESSLKQTFENSGNQPNNNGNQDSPKSYSGNSQNKNTSRPTNNLTQQVEEIKKNSTTISKSITGYANDMADMISKNLAGRQQAETEQREFDKKIGEENWNSYSDDYKELLTDRNKKNIKAFKKADTYKKYFNSTNEAVDYLNQGDYYFGTLVLDGTKLTYNIEKYKFKIQLVGAYMFVDHRTQSNEDVIVLCSGGKKSEHCYDNINFNPPYTSLEKRSMEVGAIQYLIDWANLSKK